MEFSANFESIHVVSDFFFEEILPIFPFECCRLQNVLIVQDSTTMLVKCTLKTGILKVFLNS